MSLHGRSCIPRKIRDRSPCGHWLALVALLLSGCSEIRRPCPDELARGYILLLPGVESEGFYMQGMIAGLRDGGVEQAIEMDMWGVRPLGSLVNLTAYQANRKEAERLAGKIVEYRRRHPEGPVSIIGYSGGGGMALFTVESLPSDVSLETVVLIGAAISPRYDINSIIARCHRGVVNFYSRRDWVQIGLGTELLGTMDRERTASAGYVGFEDCKGRRLARAGLEQIAWQPEWAQLGHGGDHLGWLARDWAREVLAPKVKPDVQIAARPKGDGPRGDLR